MAIPFGISVDLMRNQILNVGLQVEPSAPNNPFTGQVYYNSTDGRFYGYSGVLDDWIVLDSLDALDSISASDIVSAINGSTEVINGANVSLSDKAVTLAKMNDLTAKTIIGRKESTDGVPQALTAGEVRSLLNVADGANKYVHPNHTGDVTSNGDGVTTISNKAVTLTKMNDLTKKTIIGRKESTDGVPQALTAGEVRTLLNVADGANNYVHPSGTNPHGTTKSDVGLGSVTDNAQIKKRSSSTKGNIPTWGDTTGDSLDDGYSVQTTLSDTNASTALATAAAIKSYVDGLLAANDAMIYIDAINASGNPKYPAASTGHTYKISAAGKIGGAQGPSVEIGDMIICISDNTVEGTHSEVGSKWNIIQTNIDGAVIGPSTATGNNFVVFDGDSGKLIKNSTYNANSFAEKTHNHVGTHTRKYSANLSANKTQTITHGLNTEDVIVMVRETGGNKSRIMTDVNITGTDTISIGFADTPTANAYRVTVIG